MEHILDTKLHVYGLRKHFNLQVNTPLTIASVQAIYEKGNKDPTKKLMIVDRNYDGEIDLSTSPVVLLEKGHYYIMKEARSIPYKGALLRH